MDKIFIKYKEAYWNTTDTATAILTVTDAILCVKPCTTYSTVVLVFDLSLPGFYLSAWENEVDLDPNFQLPLEIKLGEEGCIVSF